MLAQKEDTPLFAEAYGLVSKAFNVPNRVDTKFNLGSMSCSPSEFTDLVMTGKVDTDIAPGVRYGYGFADAMLKGLRVVGHNGGFPGINAHLDIYLDQQYIVAVLANYDPPIAFQVVDKVRDLIIAAS